MTEQPTTPPADPSEDARPQAETVGQWPPATLFDSFGNIRVEGGAPPPRRAASVFGDVRIDLRELRTDVALIELTLWSVFGDVDVIVAEGVDAVLDGWTILGNRRSDLAPPAAGSRHPAGRGPGAHRPR